jgi:DNA repair protein RadC
MAKRSDGFQVVKPFRYRVSLVREETTEYDQGVLLSRPESVVRYLWTTLFHDFDREAMAAVYLDVRNRLIGVHLAYVGTLNRAAVEPRGLLVAGLLCNAAGLLVGHNHPTGDPDPSAEDVLFTRRLAKAGEVVGVRLVDHLIVAGPSSWVSLRDRGAW